MDENDPYDEVASELRAKVLIPGMWARAFAEAEGNMDRARALYIKHRAGQLAQERSNQQEEQMRQREAHERRAEVDRGPGDGDGGANSRAPRCVLKGDTTTQRALRMTRRLTFAVLTVMFACVSAFLGLGMAAFWTVNWVDIIATLLSGAAAFKCFKAINR
jgi:hypothetical protein